MISVMYADDEEGLLEPGKLFLEKSGQCSADSVASATKALQKTESTSYDAIVSDYEILGIEGIAFLKIIRAEFPDIIIYLPDATRVINPSCRVIASSKAIDEITGVKT